MTSLDQSYVEPILNSSALSQVDLRQHLPSLLELDFPIDILPSFLHEATHHWCFLSPVGSAVSLLRLRSHRRATLLKNRENNDRYLEWDLIDDVMKTEVALEALRPLSEGMACFSEFDTTPGSTNAISQPLNTALRCFGASQLLAKERSNILKRVISRFLSFVGIGKKKGSSPNIPFFQLLLRSRLDPQLWKRRESVLASRFHPKYGGHLAGYLTLKNIRTAMLQTSDKAADDELFLSFIHSYIYEDYALVAKILDPELHEQQAANEIGIYIQQRLKNLFRSDIDERLSRYEKSKFHGSVPEIPGKYGPHFVYDGLDNDPDLVNTGIQLINELLGEVVDAPDNIDDIWPDSNPDDEELWKFTEFLMRQVHQRNLIQRTLMRIGSMDVRVKVNDEARVIVSEVEDPLFESPIHYCGALDNTDPGEAEGSLEFFLSASDFTRILAIFRGNDCVGAIYQKGTNGDVEWSITDLVSAAASDSAYIKEAENNLQATISENTIEIVHSAGFEEFHDRIEQTYLQFATATCPNEAYESAMETLKTGDLYGFLEGDHTFIHQLAFIGPVSSIFPQIAQLRKIGDEHNIDVDAFIEKAKKIEKNTGLRLIVGTPEHLVCLI